MRVLRSPTGPLDDTVAAERPITFEHLLTHRSGITYGDFHPGPLDAAYQAALGPHIDNPIAPDDWIVALARLPLIDQPGGGFHYGHSTDLLGFLIARIEGRPLDEVLRRRIFDPLGMKDTGFAVPPSQRHRCAATHSFDAAGRLVRFDAPSTGAFLAERPEGMTYCGGGAGLWSTVDDYLAFARLFVEGGRGLLRPETIAMMRTNRLSPEQRAKAEMMGMRPFAVGHGFGLGLAVVVEPEQAQVVRCGGGEGSVGWPGAYGGWWQADPNDGSVLIFLTHNMVELAQLAEGVGLGVYMAITDFQRLASAA
jgi:CubicO group peptidase (beta-lactamase class C family)